MLEVAIVLFSILEVYAADLLSTEVETFDQAIVAFNTAEALAVDEMTVLAFVIVLLSMELLMMVDCRMLEL